MWLTWSEEEQEKEHFEVTCTRSHKDVHGSIISNSQNLETTGYLAIAECITVTQFYIDTKKKKDYSFSQ